VLHASDLPHGRGWSPHIWEIISGAESITLTLLEAADKVDSGKIWKKLQIAVPKHALWDEIDRRLFEAEIELINFAIANLNVIHPQEQDPSLNATYLPRRTPDDSRVDPYRSLAEQFDQIRVCDPMRFPAFFELHGHRYILTLEKNDEQSNHD
jgi:methionyl-tRNA formyltransferase